MYPKGWELGGNDMVLTVSTNKGETKVILDNTIKFTDVEQIEECFKSQKYEMLNFISEGFYFCSRFRSISIFSWQLNSEGDVLAGVNTYRLKKNALICSLSFEHIVELRNFREGTFFI